MPISPLSEIREETLLETGGEPSSHGCFRRWTTEDMAVGFGRMDISLNPLREGAYRLYQDMFAALRGKSLHRIWNFLPSINEGEGDEENYRQFCFGRSDAFHNAFNDEDANIMPAGTCVGCDGSELIVVALAGSSPSRHFENPNQVPAYRYPRQFGPRSPSFARASAVLAGGKLYRYISGTAAVIGYESKGIGDLDEQLRIACDNVECIAEQALLKEAVSLASGKGPSASGKIYLRHADGFKKAQAYIEKRFPDWSSNVIFLRSDICRKELLVEMEFTIVDDIQ